MVEFTRNILHPTHRIPILSQASGTLIIPMEESKLTQTAPLVEKQQPGQTQMDISLPKQIAKVIRCGRITREKDNHMFLVSRMVIPLLQPILKGGHIQVLEGPTNKDRVPLTRVPLTREPTVASLTKKTAILSTHLTKDRIPDYHPLEQTNKVEILIIQPKTLTKIPVAATLKSLLVMPAAWVRIPSTHNLEQTQGGELNITLAKTLTHIQVAASPLFLAGFPMASLSSPDQVGR